MIVGMFGSRFGGKEDTIRIVLESLRRQYGDNLQIVIGDCVSVDEQVYRCCKKLGIKVKVLKVWRNKPEISYEPDEEDVLEIVGEGIPKLKRRLAMRSVRLVEFIESNNGFLIGV